ELPRLPVWCRGAPCRCRSEVLETQPLTEYPPIAPRVALVRVDVWRPIGFAASNSSGRAGLFAGRLDRYPCSNLAARKGGTPDKRGQAVHASPHFASHLRN